jgi:hypothetical protein
MNIVIITSLPYLIPQTGVYTLVFNYKNTICKVTAEMSGDVYWSNSPTYSPSYIIFKFTNTLLFRPRDRVSLLYWSKNGIQKT